MRLGTRKRIYRKNHGTHLEKFICFALLANGWGITSADVGIVGSLQYLENPRRLEDSRDDDLVRGISVDADYARETSNFDVSFAYRATAEDYKNDIQSDREFIEGSGTLTWKAIPEVLRWDLSNTRSNQLFDASRGVTADNQQIVDFTSTGPTLTLPIGSSNLLDLQLDYTIADYEESGRLDQIRKSANGSFTHQFSGALSGALRASFTETEFDREASSFDYDLVNYSAYLEYSNRNFTLSVESGEYRIMRSGQSDETSPLFTLIGSYRLSSRSNITLSYRDTVEDLSSDFNFYFGNAQIDFQEGDVFPGDLGSSNSAGIYYQESESIAYNFVEEGVLNFQLSYRTDDRENQLSSSREENESISATVSVPVGARLNLSGTANYSEYTFSSLTTLQERTQYRIGANYTVNDNLSLSLSVLDLNQDSDDTGFSYDDFNALFSVSYRF